MNSTDADDLRFVRKVVEEHQCLGLDVEYSTKYRSVIIRQVERAESDQVRSPDPEPVQV
jgi:hypothetical protein